MSYTGHHPGSIASSSSCRARVVAPAADPTARPASRSSSFLRALRVAARAFFAHTLIGCPAQVAVTGGGGGIEGLAEADGLYPTQDVGDGLTVL
ncbi:hypothetical protein [Streptomyces sp. NPDC053720]|uniref:hypothetical protein n=1 Tax=Streptomyces sp. NPDC053720 TaxID=3154855 RepID=UPI00341BE5BE